MSCPVSKMYEHLSRLNISVACMQCVTLSGVEAIRNLNILLEKYTYGHIQIEWLISDRVV